LPYSGTRREPGADQIRESGSKGSNGRKAVFVVFAPLGRGGTTSIVPVVEPTSYFDVRPSSQYLDLLIQHFNKDDRRRLDQLPVSHTNQTSKYFSIRKPQICINDSWNRGNGRKGSSPELNISLAKKVLSVQVGTMVSNAKRTGTI
jgi:hypothetical protein